MQDHLDMVCAELKHTQEQLSNTQETTRNLEEKMETLQRQLEEKRSGDQGNGNTRFVWKIEKFSEILGRARAMKQQRKESSVFYTENYGYKLKISISFNLSTYDLSRYEFIDGLSASIVLIKGEYDAILPWPFNRNVILTLIDQKQDPEKRENLVCKGYSHKLWNRPKPGQSFDVQLVALFVSYEKLQTRWYIVDDTLFLQAEVTSP